MCLETDGRRDFISPLSLITKKKDQGKKIRIHNIHNIYNRLYKSVTKWHDTQITSRLPIININNINWERQMDTDRQVYSKSVFCILQPKFIKEECPSLSTYYTVFLTPAARNHLASVISFSFTNIWEHKSYRKSLGGSCTACRYARLCARRMAPLRHTAMI